MGKEILRSADGNGGSENVVLEHGSCILTDEVGSGNTGIILSWARRFGRWGTVPDSEEMAHMACLSSNNIVSGYLFEIQNKKNTPSKRRGQFLV